MPRQVLFEPPDQRVRGLRLVLRSSKPVTSALDDHEVRLNALAG